MHAKLPETGHAVQGERFLGLTTDRLRVYARMRMRIPSASPELMERPRLMRRLTEVATAKLSLIQAPAGYGKTSLVQQWSRQLVANGARVAWLTVDRADRDAEQFLVSVFHALEESGQPFPEALCRQIAAETLYSWRIVAAQVANSFIGQSEPLYLAMDELQQLRGTASLSVLQYLIDNSPPQVRFVLVSREDLGIPLGRLRANSHVVVLRTEDLRFLPQETGHYFIRCGHAPLTPQQLEALDGRAEGWIVGLKLLSMAMHLDPQQSLLPTDLCGEQRDIADYFVEDVLSSQPGEVQDFMLRTSVLDRVSPPLCDALPGLRGSRALLDRCDADGLFLIGLDHTRTWYRYHSLFADFLRRQLHERHPGLAEEIYLAASHWHEQAGFHTEAFDYALRAKNPIRAAQILDSQCDAMWSAGRQPLIQSLAERLPPHVQALYPRIMLAMAWRLVARWKIDQAQHLLAVTRTRLEELKFNSADAASVRSLEHRALHRETQIAHHLYQLEKVERLSRQLLEDDAFAEDPYTKASVLITLQYALREQFQLAQVPRLSELAHAAMSRTGFSHGLVFHAAMAGPSFFMAGRTRDATRILTEGLQIARQLSGPGSDLGAVVGLHLAQLQYECNDLDGARALIGEYFRAEPSAGVMDQLVAGFTVKARLLRLSGDTSGALDTLEQAAEFADRHLMQRLKVVCNAERVRLLLRNGRLQEAARLARHTGLAHAPQAPARRGRVTSAESGQVLAWCQLAGAQNRVGEALLVARRWRAHVSTAQAIFAAVEWGVMVAQLLWLGGDRRAAQRALWQAVEMGCTAGISRAFLDGGEPIALILEQMTGGDPMADTAVDSFTRQLAQLALDQHHSTRPALVGVAALGGAGMAGRLTARELEILVLAGGGMLNKRISEKLGLTEGTVKWYMQQVFDKLGVRDRSRAAAKARHLGLIG